MKKLLQILLLLLVTTLGSSSCISTRDAARINQVEIGMTKDDIQRLLGNPLFKNADMTGEEWGYRKLMGEVIDAHEMIFIVSFDTDGKVIAYDSVKEHPHFHHY